MKNIKNNTNNYILWTIQPEEVWLKLQEEEILFTDISHPRIEKYFIPAYDWLKEKLVEKIPGYDINHYPWWAWQKYNEDKHEPDLRRIRYYYYNEPLYKITLSIPKDQVVLSDFDWWHSCLNYNYLSLTQEEDTLFDKKWLELLADQNSCYPDLRKATPEQLKIWEAEVKESWNRIFSLEYKEEYKDWGGINNPIQANFESLKLEQVIKVKKFNGVHNKSL